PELSGVLKYPDVTTKGFVVLSLIARSTQLPYHLKARDFIIRYRHGNRAAVVVEINRVDIPPGVNGGIEDDFHFVAHLDISRCDLCGPVDLLQNLRSCRDREATKSDERYQETFTHTSISIWPRSRSSMVSRFRISFASPLITITSAGRSREL